MKLKSTYKHPEGKTFEIHYEPYMNGGGVWFLYIWNAEGKNTHDYHQDTFELAKEHAFEDFEVPLDSWKEIEGNK